MSNEFPQEQFPTAEELLKRLQERSDDFESVSLMVPNDLPIKGPQGQLVLAKDCCGLIKTCTGESIRIHRDDF